MPNVTFPLLKVPLHRSGSHLGRAFAIGLSLALAVSIVPIAQAAQGGAPNWTPQSSERLVKLPPSYLRKSLDHDFQQSQLGVAMQQADENLGLKSATLKDLQSAISQSGGEVRQDLRLQFLGAKREYINMMSKRNDLKRQQLETKRRVYESILNKMAENKNIPASQKTLIDQQEAAAKRFESSFDRVDMQLFKSGMASDSKYGQKHHENVAAIEKLMARIQGHKMNAHPEENGRPLTRMEELRRMATDTDAELALLDQEETILGYMAKLVALDAMALADESLDTEFSEVDLPGSKGPSGAVSFFLDN